MGVKARKGIKMGTWIEKILKQLGFAIYTPVFHLVAKYLICSNFQFEFVATEEGLRIEMSTALFLFELLLYELIPTTGHCIMHPA